MAAVLAKVGLQRLQLILDAQEVDLPALLELDDEVWLLTFVAVGGVYNRLVDVIFPFKGLERVGGPKFNRTGSTSPSFGQDQA